MATSDLETLLGKMEPTLDGDEFVFASTPPERIAALYMEAICMFREREGVTLILRRQAAETLGLSSTFPCKMITLNIASNLEAVGFLAKVTVELAERGISVNPVSAYHHDHLFVPKLRATEALQVLQELQFRFRVNPQSD